MAPDPHVDNGPQGTSLAELQGPLPPELWGVVLSKADYRSLKAARKINSIFRELATPLLFDHVVYSVDERILKNLRVLAKNADLSKHVQRLYLDTTCYRQGIDSRQYSQLTASYYQNIFHLRKQSNSSPLSEQSLLRVLRADPVEDLGIKCLSGAARRAYVASFSTYLARSDYYREQLQDDGVYKQLKDLIPKFSSLKHFETITLWSPLNSRQQFEDFIRRTLPDTTLRLISGLEGAAVTTDGKLPLLSAYCAPGQTSRRLNTLTPPPNFSGCWGDATVFDVLTAALRALHETNPKLERLSLPGSDDLGEHMSLQERMGIVPVPSVVTVPRSTPDATKKTLLLPLFANLKHLELKLDFAHPGTPNTFKYHMDPSRLCTALHKMQQIETLCLGAVDYPVEAQTEPWSIYEALLRSADDDKTLLPDWSEEADEDNDDDGLGPGALPAGMQGITLAMLAASLGIPPPPGTPGQAAPNATTPATSSTTGTPAASSTVPTSTPDTSPPSDPTPRVHPSTALKPNPWPNLRRLHLFNMPATKEDLSRLVRTIAQSPLKNLELHNIYLDDRLQTHGGMVSSPTSPPSYPYEKIAPHWLEIIDLMGDQLHLQKASIRLSERDTDYMFDLMLEQIDGFDDVNMAMGLDIDDLIGDFVVGEGARGMDFASYVGGVVAEMEEDMDDEEDEDEDGSENESDEDLPDLI